jgi:hypothetical protein
MPALFALALAVLPIVVTSTVSGCSKDDPFVTRHCAFNDNPRVSANRIVTLFATNYVYESSRDSSADRGIYSTAADDKIDAAYKSMNRIFAADGINLQVVPWTTDDRINEKLDVFHAAGFNGTASVEDIDEMVRAHQGFSQLIGVHWYEWDRGVRFDNSEGQAPLSGGLCRDDRCNWVLMAGFLHKNSPLDVSRTLAHEFGHYFNLEHVTSPPDDLMVEGGSGTVLTAQQRDIMWASINTSPVRTTLFSMTCDPPIAIAPRRPEFSPVPEPSTRFTAGEPTVRK